MEILRTTPVKEFKAARAFNFIVAGLVFSLTLAFAAWVSVGALTDRPVEWLRALAGGVMAVGALMLLMGVHGGWRAGEPFQHRRRFVVGMALLGIGLTILVADLG